MLGLRRINYWPEKKMDYTHEKQPSVILWLANDSVNVPPNFRRGSASISTTLVVQRKRVKINLSHDKLEFCRIMHQMTRMRLLRCLRKRGLGAAAREASAGPWQSAPDLPGYLPENQQLDSRRVRRLSVSKLIDRHAGTAISAMRPAKNIDRLGRPLFRVCEGDKLRS